MGIRLAVVVVVAEMLQRHAGSSHWPMYLYLILPYIAAFYFETRWMIVLGAIVWVIATGHRASEWLGHPLLLGPDNHFFADVGMFSVVLAAVALMAKLAGDEIQSRRRVEALLAHLRRSHRQLNVAAEQALALTHERNHLARAIHTGLGQALITIGVQLDKAIQFRPRDPVTADDAVREAKQLGSDALADVRRSVAALRVKPVVLDPPAGLPLPAAATRPRRPPAWRAWMLPNRLHLVPTVWCVVLLVLFVPSLRSPDDEFVLRLTLLGALPILLALDRLGYWLCGDCPRPRAKVLLVMLHVALFGGVVAVTGFWYAMWLLPLLPYIGFLYFGTRAALRISAGTWVAYIALLTFLASREGGDPFDLSTWAYGVWFLSFFFVLVVVTSYTALNERAQRAHAEHLIGELEIAHQDLRTSAEQMLAATEARNQLARDMHDGLGHYLTVVNVQLEKAIAFRSVDAAIADRALADAKRLAAAALSDVRSSFGALDTTHAPLALRPALEQLVHNVGDTLTVDVAISGQADDFSEQALLALYRVAQEALTNIQKHAAARRVAIDLQFGAQEAHLQIRDDGCGFDPSVRPRARSRGSGGYGLQGMRERLEIVGGTLQVHTARGAGTAIDAVVPKTLLAQRGQRLMEEAV
jgi:signal transduction histidine kinase